MHLVGKWLNEILGVSLNILRLASEVSQTSIMEVS